jgi:hypothetical protein
MVAYPFCQPSIAYCQQLVSAQPLLKGRNKKQQHAKTAAIFMKYKKMKYIYTSSSCPLAKSLNLT